MTRRRVHLCELSGLSDPPGHIRILRGRGRQRPGTWQPSWQEVERYISTLELGSADHTGKIKVLVAGGLSVRLAHCEHRLPGSRRRRVNVDCAPRGGLGHAHALARLRRQACIPLIVHARQQRVISLPSERTRNCSAAAFVRPPRWTSLTSAAALGLYICHRGVTGFGQSQHKSPNEIAVGH